MRLEQLEKLIELTFSTLPPAEATQRICRLTQSPKHYSAVYKIVRSARSDEEVKPSKNAVTAWLVQYRTAVEVERLYRSPRLRETVRAHCAGLLGANYDDAYYSETHNPRVDHVSAPPLVSRIYGKLHLSQGLGG